jgi:hypothetical protein
MCSPGRTTLKLSLPFASVSHLLMHWHYDKVRNFDWVHKRQEDQSSELKKHRPVQVYLSKRSDDDTTYCIFGHGYVVDYFTHSRKREMIGFKCEDALSVHI